MYQVNFIQKKLLRMFNQIVSESVRENLTMYLMEVVDQCGDERAGVIAETLLKSIQKYRNPRCSEKQALAVAYGAYERNIYLF